MSVKSANEVAMEVLARMKDMSDEELKEAIDNAPKHEMTEALEKAGYFDLLREELVERGGKRLAREYWDNWEND